MKTAMGLCRRMTILAAVLMVILGISVGVGASTKLVLVGFGDQNMERYINIGVDVFQETHPEVDVEVQMVAGGARGMDQRLLSMWASGLQLDVFRLQTGFSNAYYQQDLLEVLDGYIERDSDPPDVADFVPSQLVFEGDRVGFPWSLQPLALRVNRDLFNEAGMQPPDELWINAEKEDRGPEVWTWDKFLEMGKRLTRDTNGDGEIDQWASTDGGIHVFLDMIWAFGRGEIFSEDGRKSLVDDPAALRVFEYVQNLVQEHAVMPPPGVSASFNDGQLATQPGWLSVVLPPALAEAPFSVGFAPIPAGPAGFGIRSGSNTWAVSARSTQKELAYELSKALVSQATQMRLVDEGGILLQYVSRSSVLGSPEMDTAIRAYQDVDVLHLFDSAAKYKRTPAPQRQWAEVMAGFNQIWSDLKSGDISPEQAQEDFHHLVQALLAR